MNRITLDGLKKVLGGREMKNVTRGSGCCISYHGVGSENYVCVPDCETDGGSYGCGCNTADAKDKCSCGGD